MNDRNCFYIFLLTASYCLLIIPQSVNGASWLPFSRGEDQSSKNQTVTPTQVKSPVGYQKLLQTYNCNLGKPWNSTLNCDSKKLNDSLPDNINFPPHIEYVDFKNNKISELSSSNFRNGSKVRVMYFANNQIMSIENDTFKRMPNIETLDLSHNDLVRLNSNTFNGLNKLISIDLGYNRLIEFNHNLFWNRRIPLRELRLNHNEIKELNEDSFSSLHNLDALDLEDNILSELPENLFMFNEKLRDLKLSMNRFYVVPNPALKGAKVLSILDLSSNRFKEFNYQDFESLTQVTKLRLSRITTLERINEHSFQDLVNLRLLYIEYNRKLTFIHPYAFHSNNTEGPICEITEISLKGNSLTTLSKDTLNWNDISDIDLSENPWKCDCHLRWIMDIVYNLNNATADVLHCKKPYKHFNQLIKSMSSSDFACSFFESDAIIVGAILLIVLSITGFISICIILVKFSVFEKVSSLFCPTAAQVRRKFNGETKYTGIENNSKVELRPLTDNGGAPSEYKDVPQTSIAVTE